MEQYKKLCEDILAQGKYKRDRTNTGTISMFGHQSRYDLSKGFPLLTTKKVYFKGVLVELLWFISGSTNIQPLVQQNVHIWDDWPFEKYKNSVQYQGETIKEFAAKVANDDEFAKKWGDLGPVYGYQWRNFFGVDQIKEIEHSLKLINFQEDIFYVHGIQHKLKIWPFHLVIHLFNFMLMKMIDYLVNYIKEVLMCF